MSATSSYFQSSVLDSSKLLNNLGKATKRGIKKCPKCGIYNGTRGILCKNKRCDAVFKEQYHEDRRKSHLDAVRLAGIVRKVYSVRVKDTGPDYRGFVQLPLLPEEHSLSLCFVDSCQRLFDDSILKCHEENQESSTICGHVDAAIKSTALAIPVQFKMETLATLRVSPEMQNRIGSLITEKKGPLVQRVSRSVMAVKCQVTPKHPLGYLHFTFGSTRKRDVFDKYLCSCTEPDSGNTKCYIRPKCVHYYACICALASDSKCTQEFQFFINCEFSDKAALHKTVARTSNELFIEKCVNSFREKPATRLPSGNKAKATKAQAKMGEPCLKKYKKLAPNIIPVEIRVLDSEVFSQEPVWRFTDWLTTVTELINNQMQLDNYGNINTLQFFIPDSFYKEFQERIPAIYKHGQCYADLFHIMNILHLKEIFDTPEVKLKISKRFVLSEDSASYVEYFEKDHETPDYQPNFIFFLNVGQSTVDESEDVNNPFLIQWIPNIASTKNVGELKLQFKYGRKST